MNREEQAQVALIILRTAQHLHSGKEKLALFLRGSQSQLIKRNKLDRETGYGSLFWHDIPTIKGFIAQLLQMGFLQEYKMRTGTYAYPILVLSETGTAALARKIQIPLLLKKERKPMGVGDTEKETLALFRKGLPPTEIAKRRGLAVSTIFAHFTTLVSVGEIKARQCVQDDVIQKILRLQQQGTASLKEFKQLLPEDITYEEIRIVLADNSLRKDYFSNSSGTL